MLHFSMAMSVGEVIRLGSMVKLNRENVVCLAVETYLLCVEVLGEIGSMT